MDLYKLVPVLVPVGLIGLSYVSKKGLGLGIRTLGTVSKHRGDTVTFKVRVKNETDASFSGGLGVAIKDSENKIYFMNKDLNEFVPSTTPCENTGIKGITLGANEEKEFSLGLKLPSNIAYGDVKIAVGVWEKADPCNPGNWLAFYPAEGPGNFASTDTAGNKITIVPSYKLEVVKVTIS